MDWELIIRILTLGSRYSPSVCNSRENHQLASFTDLDVQQHQKADTEIFEKSKKEYVSEVFSTCKIPLISSTLHLDIGKNWNSAHQVMHLWFRESLIYQIIGRESCNGNLSLDLLITSDFHAWTINSEKDKINTMASN
ncbi:hypothetical protein VP01_2453g2 [Puccinia sorghi]|uniref:Uncharacterized protein n=1 Tax=Puccinia sorghi TaxID=27349 RepID=A0A0L6V6T3_9BASI|nr:hypothetical protein VP01_2453g2 [Puccinia sorghi]